MDTSTLIQSPETGNFQTLGHCPAGFIEHRIIHKNWYGETQDSGWKWCEKKDATFSTPHTPHTPYTPPVPERKITAHTVRRIR